MKIINEIWPDTSQEIIICKRLRGDRRSVLGEKLKRVLRKHNVLWRNTSTHIGVLTQEQFGVLCGELVDVVRSHPGPGQVIQLIAKIGSDQTWIDLLDVFEIQKAA